MTIVEKARLAELERLVRKADGGLLSARWRIGEFLSKLHAADYAEATETLCLTEEQAAACLRFFQSVPSSLVEKMAKAGVSWTAAMMLMAFSKRERVIDDYIRGKLCWTELRQQHRQLYNLHDAGGVFDLGDSVRIVPTRVQAGTIFNKTSGHTRELTEILGEFDLAVQNRLSVKGFSKLIEEKRFHNAKIGLVEMHRASTDLLKKLKKLKLL